MPDDVPALTVREALALPVLQHGLPEVVAAEGALDRAVSWAHVLDIVEVAGLLRGGELILSTGLGSGDDPGEQRAFVRSLAEEGAAALVVELGTTYRRALPRALVDEAARRDLPLVALRRRVRFVQVTHAITTALLSTELATLRHADAVLRRLLDAVQRGEGVGGVVADLARTVRNPVVLEDAAGHLVRHDAHDAGDDVVLAAWDDLARAETRGEAPGGVHTAEVRVGGRPWGRLIALQLDAPLHELDRVALDRGALALGAALRGGPRDLLRAQGGGALLGELRRGRLAPDDAQRRAAAAGFPRRHETLLPLVAVWRGSAWAEAGGAPDAAWAAVAADVRTALADAGWPSLAGAHGPELLAVVAAPGEAAAQADRHRGGAGAGTGLGGDADVTTPDRVRDRVAAAVHAALGRRGLREADVALAIGAEVGAWDQLGDVLERAARGAGAAAGEPPRAWYDARRTGVADLLFAMRDGPHLRAFVRDRLGPLLERDDARTRALLHTLEAYLAEGGRKASTARALHLERQSLYYRLQRIEELLGVSLDDEESVLGLHLALRAARYAGLWPADRP